MGTIVVSAVYLETIDANIIPHYYPLSTIHISNLSSQYISTTIRISQNANYRVYNLFIMVTI